MKRTVIIKKIDYLFLFAVLFFMAFIVLNYFVRNTILCMLLSFGISYALYFVVTKIILHHNIRISSKKTDQTAIANLKQYFAASGTKTAKSYLKIVLNCEESAFGLESEKDIFFVNFEKQELTIYDFNLIYSALKDSTKTKYIIAEKLSDSLSNILSKLQEPIAFLDIETLYFEHIKDKHPLPTLDIKQKNPTKNTFKKVISLAFCKSKSKKYFFNGILIMLFSFIYPFHNYYFVFSLILFCMAIVSFFEPFKSTCS